ncbi:MAG: hypothetical protein KGK08_12720 [Acidobacteriota bacterium]|nr:hypothetical protein [Acidobacteriota bacterium]
MPSVSTQPLLHASDTVTLRRPTMQQGRALEVLGHAVEYLIDSRMFEPGCTATQSDQEAAAILMALSRAVFHEAAPVKPLRQRLAGWLTLRPSGRRDATAESPESVCR